MKDSKVFDNVDLRILEILQVNAQTKFSDMAEELRVSSGTIHVRTKKLKEMGVIQGATIKMNLDKIGFHIQAFIGLNIDANANLNNIIDRLRSVPEVLNCASTTGGYSMFIKVTAKNPVHLKFILLNKVHAIDGVQKTETFLTLENHFTKHLELTS